ncbi:glycoside hydrolase family 108 protein [Agarilytica rhodophyticola]|uniref:glycoside hydrolase family 108 protein n=1 Tax=Agarilytica rhodophyticola TaxID=1737490 RepID=UPI00131A1409|nr:glycosyl hydrolase 108 family protein [Agarilytica rhodophyticola]
MAVDVNRLIDDVLSKEGGFVDHPSDKGGATNFGITRQTLAKYLSEKVTVDDVKNLDIKTARDIYEYNYYLSPGIDRLPECIQPFVFDSAVNHGPRQAIKFLQNACNSAGFGALINDGIIGAKTVERSAACFNSLGNWMLVELVAERQIFYANIVYRDSGQSVFMVGWMRRAMSFLPKSRRLANIC